MDAARLTRAAERCVFVWMMRHGETEWNLRGLMQGHADAPLTSRGRKEALEAAALLAGLGIERVLCSDLGRALVTAELVAGSLELPLSSDPRWRELDIGRELEGQPSSIVRQLPGYQRRPDWRFPSGECLLDLRLRVLEALADLEQAGRSSLVVTHAGPLRVLLAEANERGPEGVFEQRVPRGLVLRLSCEDGHPSQPVLLRGEPAG